MKIIARKLGGVYLVQVSRDQGAGERHAPGTEYGCAHRERLLVSAGRWAS